ncbi:MAG: hypothetical protein AAFQ09_12115 [Pseudomonadota bacterium]
MMRIQKLDVGLAEISRWQIEDEQHLPRDGALVQRFLPQVQDLDQILRRPSLDERLPNLLEPKGLDSELLDPSVLADARQGAAEIFEQASKTAMGDDQTALRQAADLLAEQVALDDDIRAALAALFRG